MRAKLLYIGKRMVGKNLRHAFLWRGKELYWRGIRGLQIGYYYPSEIKDGNHTMSRNPERLGWIEDETGEITRGYAAQELAAKGSFESMKAHREERKDKATLALLEKMEPLRDLISTMTYSEKRGFMEFILDRFSPRPKKKGKKDAGRKSKNRKRK